MFKRRLERDGAQGARRAAVSQRLPQVTAATASLRVAPQTLDWQSRFQWTQPRSGASLSLMTIILILAVALATGALVQNRWALLLPLGLGVSVVSALAASGHDIGVTPIPFLVVVSTLVMVGGQGLRSVRISRRT